MARKDLPKWARDIDKWVNGVLSTDIREAAEQVVAELQAAGPIWSGEFSNSWVIETSSGDKSTPSRAKTNPQPVTGPFLTGEELWKKPQFKYSIYNVARYAGVAIDYEQGNFFRPKEHPYPLQEQLNPEMVTYGERRGQIRGNLDLSESGNTRTAPLDWYDNYLKGGGIDKTIRVKLNEALIKFPR